MQHKSPNHIVIGRPHNYGFNGVEENNDLSINILEMDLRQYDPAIARWTSMDPVIHHSMSTYNAFDNNPVFWTDPSGADSIYNFDTGQYVINGQVVSQQAAIDYANNGGNADGSNNNTPCCGGKKKGQKKDVKDMSAGEFYAMAYSGASRTALVNGNDPYNPTEEDIAQNEAEKADAAGELFMLIGGEAVFAWIGRGIMALWAARGGSTLISNANWAQKTYGAFFSVGGKFAGRTVQEVAAALRSGKMVAKDIPIDIVVRNGQSLILNTRSSAALTRAGIPRAQWNVVNRTGQDFFENQLTNQLTRNNLSSAGVSTIRQSGTKNVIGF